MRGPRRRPGVRHPPVPRLFVSRKNKFIIKAGEGRYCIIAEWDDLESMSAARPEMIATLDSFRDTLEDLGGGLGVTDPAAGPVVLALK